MSLNQAPDPFLHNLKVKTVFNFEPDLTLNKVSVDLQTSRNDVPPHWDWTQVLIRTADFTSKLKVETNVTEPSLYVSNNNDTLQRHICSCE